MGTSPGPQENSDVDKAPGHFLVLKTLLGLYGGCQENKACGGCDGLWIRSVEQFELNNGNVSVVSCSRGWQSNLADTTVR